MVGVVGSSPIAPTKFGRWIKGLALSPSPLSLAVRKKYGTAGRRMRNSAGPWPAATDNVAMEHVEPARTRSSKTLFAYLAGLLMLAAAELSTWRFVRIV